MPRVTVGSKVRVASKKSDGTIMFVGETSFINNENIIWYGIKLDKSNGNNNGTIAGRKYFECKNKYGTFARQNSFEIIDATPPIKDVDAKTVTKVNQIYTYLYVTLCVTLFVVWSVRVVRVLCVPCDFVVFSSPDVTLYITRHSRNNYRVICRDGVIEVALTFFFLVESYLLFCMTLRIQ